MPVSWGSDVVNGQLVPRAPASAVFPLTFSAEFTGPGVWPKQGTYQVPPVVPGAYVQSRSAPGSFGTAAASANYSPSAGNINSAGIGPTNASASGNVFHPTKGIIVFAFLFLALSLFGLQYIHWK